MRIDILIKLLEALSALVLAVTLYGITRDEDHELAMLGMVCRVAEGVLGTLSIPSYLGLVWLAKAAVGPDALDMSTTNALRTFLLMPGAERTPRYGLFRRGEFDLFLSPPARTDGACLNRMAGRVRVGPARGGAAPASSPVSPQGRLTGYYQWLPALVFQVALALWLLDQRCRHTGDAMSPTPQDV